MDSDIEGIGTAITGGLAARAIEPAHGEGDGDERICANCATVLVGTHCHLCGQKAHVHRTISAIGHDLIHGVLHLDGKFWRTLPLLIRRPGELTRRYVEGERAKFVSPLGMFLFAVFLMFGILQIYGVSLSSLDTTGGNGAFSMEVARERVASELEEAREDRERVAADLADGDLTEEQAAAEYTEIDARIAEFEERAVALERIGELGGNFRVADTGFTTGWERLDRGIEKINANPGLALYKLQANGYKFSWLLIPLSVPFVWVLFFYTRRFRMYDHTVFVTYSLAFMSLLAIVLTVLGFAGLGTPWIPLAAVFVPPLHMYKQLKYGYRLSRFGALVRTFLLSIFCFITATIYFVLLLGIGALG